MISFLVVSLLTVTVSASPRHRVMASWSCNQANVERLREAQTVEISFSDAGEIKLKPNLLRTNPGLLASVRNLFVRRGAAGDINPCLSAFQVKAEAAFSQWRGSRCAGRTAGVCSPTFLNNHFAETLSRSRFSRGAVRTATPTLSTAPVDAPESNDDQVFADAISNPGTSRDEVSTLLRDYSLANADYLLDDATFREQFCATESECTAAQARRTRIQENLRRAAQRLDPESPVTTVACTETPVAPVAQDLASLLEQVTKTHGCEPLRNGEGRERGGLHSRRYFLKRLSDGNYVANVHVSFSEAAPGLASQLQSRINECMAMAAPFLRGTDGSRLNVRVMSPDEAQALPDDERPPRAGDIRAHPGGGGAANTANIGVENACGTIVHEVLHYLGLCDDYPTLDPEHTCRFPVPQNTVMGNSFNLSDAIPRTLQCPCDESCQTIMNGRDEQLKTLYLGANYHDVLRGFSYSPTADPATGAWTRRCQDLDPFIPVSNASQLPSPRQNIVLKQATDTQIVIEERAVRGTQVYSRTITCPCQAGEGACEAAKENIQRWTRAPLRSGFCPANFQRQIATVAQERENTVRWGGTPVETAVIDGTLSFTSTPAYPSMVSPNQFERVINGRCEPPNGGQYLRCQEFAYKNTNCAEANDPCRDPRNYHGVWP